ncbi:MAG: hypothetical protein MI745_09645 [Pseudomonadales bacterium]|nr:hypothetical protein [Pseudomonadales bacterium]
MAWETVSKYSLKNGNYRVSLSYTRETQVFTAWPPKPPYQKLNWQASVHQCIGCYPTAEAAKAACATHAATAALCSFAYRLSSNKNKPTAPC